MSACISFEARVIRDNVVLFRGRELYCWKNAIYEAVAPQPLDLQPHAGKLVALRGYLYGELWSASFEGVIEEDPFVEITGKVTGYNEVTSSEGSIRCYRHDMNESVYEPLMLLQYFAQTITVSGTLHGSDLYRAQITRIPEPVSEFPPEKEARSINDLLRIREANREALERVNGNLGTALGNKWTNNRNTKHPAIIVFVPQKTPIELVPPSERIEKALKGPGDIWCHTDVVTGGKIDTLEEMSPLPELTTENAYVVDLLRSGRVGLVGGIQLSFFVDGVQDANHAAVGTAAVAVEQTSGDGKVGFLTNYHVGDAPGRTIYHPDHLRYPIGHTRSMQEFETDEDWYEGVIDESQSYVRCDCAFVQIEDVLKPYLQSGVFAIGNVGEVYEIDQSNMDIVGKPVISVGRTRGIQRGTVAAYAYEFHDDQYSLYTDLLIIGEEGKAFSWKGDSGKLIVTDDNAHQPVALLWGGWQEKLRHGKEQENWSYAIDLKKVLKRLGLKIYRPE